MTGVQTCALPICEELEGEADFATGDWTVAIPEGTEEVLLTVHVIEGEFDPTLQLRADAPFAFNSGARAAIARVGGGEETTEYYFVTLRNGQEPADITNVKPEGAATFVEAKKWLPGKEGYTIWRVTIAYDANALGGDLNNLNFAVTGKNEGEEPGAVTVTVTLDGTAVEMTKNEDGTWTGTLTIPAGKKLTETSGENWSVGEDNVITVSNVTESVTIALTTVTDNKLVVEAVPEKEKLSFTNAPDKYKYVFEIQDPLTVVAGTDGKTINVSGVSKYVSSWAEWGNNEGAYYIALKLSCPGVPADSIWFKSVDGQAPGQGPNTGYKKLSKDGTNENGDEYGILVWMLSEDDQGVRKNIDVKIGNETFVIDLSGVKKGADNEVLMVEAVGADEQITETITSGVKDYGKKGGDIQNITVGELSGNTIKVTGTTKYVGTAWGEYGAANNTGFFVALKISYPGIKPTDIKGSYGAGSKKQLSTDKDAEAGDAGLALIRLDNDDLGRQKNFTVEVAGKTYIIDLRDVVKGATADVLTVEPVPADRELLRTKKGSDLQDIQVTGQDHDIKVTGTLKYVSDWTAFDASLKDGYYIALAVNHTGISEWKEIELIPSDGGNGKPLGYPGNGTPDDIPENANVIIKKIDPQDKKTQSVKLKVKGIVYTIDLSGITYEDRLEITATEGSTDLGSSFGNKKPSDLNNLTSVVREGDTFKVTGDAYYVSPMAGFPAALESGYYIVLNLKSESGVNIVVPQQDPTTGSAGTAIENGQDDLIRKLYVPKGDVAENFTVQAYGKEFIVDVSGVKLVDKFTLVETDQSEELFGKHTSDLQGSNLKVTVDEANKTWTVTGDVKYIGSWPAAYGVAGTDKGWFVALDYEYVGGTLRWYSDLVKPRDLSNGKGTIITRIATTDMEIKNVTVRTGSKDVWTVDFSGVTLLGPDGTPITAAAAQALELGLEDAGFYGFEDEPEDIGFYGDVDFVD